MDNNDFIKEIEEYSLDDLKLIYEGQKELYTDEEREVIYKRICALTEEEEKIKTEYIQEHLPTEIICPKCEGPNPFENSHCSFCGYKFDKSQYYVYPQDEETVCDEEIEERQSFTFHYVISFLIPLIGYIIGAILLTKDDKEERNAGKTCIIIGIVSNVISILFVPILFL